MLIYIHTLFHSQCVELYLAHQRRRSYSGKRPITTTPPAIKANTVTTSTCKPSKLKSDHLLRPKGQPWCNGCKNLSKNGKTNEQFTPLANIYNSWSSSLAFSILFFFSHAIRCQDPGACLVKNGDQRICSLPAAPPCCLLQPALLRRWAAVFPVRPSAAKT